MPRAISRAWCSEEPKAWFCLPEIHVVTHICRIFVAEVRGGLFFSLFLYVYIISKVAFAGAAVGQWLLSGDPAQREPLVSPPLGPKTSAPGQLLLFMGEIIPLSFLQLKGSFRKTTREMSNGEFCLTAVSAILIRSVTTHLDKSTRTQTRCRGEGDEMI